MRTEFSNLPGLHLVIYGALLVIVMIFWPGGFAGVIRNLGARLEARWVKQAEAKHPPQSSEPAQPAA